MFLLIFSCKNNNEYDYALIFTGEVTDIDSTSVTFHANISDLSKFEIVEYGFVWNTKPDPTLQVGEKYIIRNKPQIGNFTKKISTSIPGGVKNYVRAFVRTTEFISYGKQVSFTPLGGQGPIVKDFFPKTGNLNDTIMIIGDNFSSQKTQVKFGNNVAKIIKINQDTIIAAIPNNLNVDNAEVSVSVYGFITVAKDRYNLIAPKITDFYQKEGTYQSELTIKGENFSTSPSSIQVYFDAYKAKCIFIDNNTLKAYVPDSLNIRFCDLKVRMNNLDRTFTDKFKLSEHSVDDFNPKIAITGQKIIITGRNFSPIVKNNKVTIGGLDTTITKATSNTIEINIPLQKNKYYQSRLAAIEVEVAGTSVKHTTKLEINDKWFRLKDAPTALNSYYSTCQSCGIINNYGYASSFSYGSKGYVGLNNSNQFWEFDPVKNSWTKLADFPGSRRLFGTGFVIDDKIYFGMGVNYQNSSTTYFNDWWEYDISSNKWTKKSDYPATVKQKSKAFAIGNTGYLSTGLANNSGIVDLYTYSTSTDTWTNISHDTKLIKVPVNWKSANGFSDHAILGFITHYGYKSDKGMFKYTPATNAWQKLADLPVVFYDEPNTFVSFTLNGTLYIQVFYQNTIYSYNGNSNTWITDTTSDIPYFSNGIGFGANNKVYTGLGQSNTMWEYDPNR